MKPIPLNDLELEIIKKEFTDLVILDLEGKNREEVLLNIAKFAKKEGLIQDEQLVYQTFLEREKKGTTAIGKGIALPEASWIEMTRPYAFILCRTKEPVDFQSLDGKPVRIVLSSLAKDKNDLTRLRPMANLTKFLKNAQMIDSFLKTGNEKAAKGENEK